MVGGSSGASAGDLNGDGYPDIVVARLGTNVYVYYGSALGLGDAPGWIAISDRANTSFGESVAGVGDLNGDGYDDILIGEPGYQSDPPSGSGRVLVFYGSANGPRSSGSDDGIPSAHPADADWNWVVEGDSLQSYGDVIARAGDVNGDGYGDVLIRTFYRLVAYYGSATGLSDSPNWGAKSGKTSGTTGVWSFGPAGDVNHDGYDDIVVGDPNFTAEPTEQGAAFVFLGSATGLPGKDIENGYPLANIEDADWFVEEEKQFASSVSTAGDVNGDGFADVIVGRNNPPYGGACAYHGSPTGLSKTPGWTLSDRVATYGTTLAHDIFVGAAGDVNGDGYDDVIIGAPDQSDKLYTSWSGLPGPHERLWHGRAYIYYGSAQGLSEQYAWTATGEDGAELGRWVGAVGGDLGGDGRADVIVGGKWNVYLYGSTGVNHAPEIISSPPADTIDAGQPFTYTVKAQDQDPYEALQYQLDNPPSGMTIDRETGVIAWTPEWNPEFYGGGKPAPVRVAVRDRLGYYGFQVFRMRVRLPGEPPAIEPVLDQIAAVDHIEIITVKASSPNWPSQDLMFALDQAPQGMQIGARSGVIKWTPSPGHAGSHLVKVRVTDPDQLFATATFSLSVSHAPVIVSSPDRTVRLGGTFSYALHAVDLDASETLTYSLDTPVLQPWTFPQGMQIDSSTGLIEWTPSSAQVGSYSVIARATDPQGFLDTQAFTIAVEPDRPPLITSYPVMDARTDRPYYYVVKARDPNSGDVLTYSLDNGPAGMTIDAGTGLIEWAPTLSQVGGHSVGLRVQDQTGLFATQSFVINVLEPGVIDKDGDGFPANSGDCNDHNPFVYPGAFDLPGDGVDQSCDGADAAAGAQVGLYPLIVYPAAIPPATPTDVTFQVRLLTPQPAPEHVTLSIEDTAFPGGWRELGSLVDDGTNGDELAGDAVYSGIFRLSGDVEGCIYTQVSTQFPDSPDPVILRDCALDVSRFPDKVEPSDMSKVVADPNTGGEIISNEVVASFARGTPPQHVEDAVRSIGGTVVGTIPPLDAYQIRIPDSGDAIGVYSAIHVLLGYSNVVAAEPNGVGKLLEVPVNDQQPQLSLIRAPETWQIARGTWSPGGSSPVTIPIRIAVLDSGIKYDHEDFSAGTFTSGWDTADDNNNPMPSNLSFATDTPEVMLEKNDYRGHGTRVAGVIAARPNNGKGTSGICWDCQIIPIKITFNADPRAFTYGTMAQGILYALGRSAKIINISAGGIITAGVGSADIADLTILRRMTLYAADEKNTLIVAAAGNEGDKGNPVYFPAFYPEVLAVGATFASSHTDKRATYSEYGGWVDISAPGAILTTDVVASYHTTAGHVDLKDYYATPTGTSVAAPMVSAAAALVWAQHPNWTYAQVRDRLIKTAKPLPGQFNPADPEHGAGLLDVFEAVFNGSFEDPNLDPDQDESGWVNEWGGGAVGTTVGTAPQLVPPDRSRMAYVMNASPTLGETFGELRKEFEVLPGTKTLTITFDYNFVTTDIGPIGGLACGVEALHYWVSTPSQELRPGHDLPGQCHEYFGDEYMYHLWGGDRLTDATIQEVPILRELWPDNTVRRWRMNGWAHATCPIDFDAAGGPGKYRIIFEIKEWRDCRLPVWGCPVDCRSVAGVFIDNVRIK